MAFAHLHCHTEYSLLDGATHIYDMVKRAADLDMPAVAITDHGVMYGVIDFYRAAKEAFRSSMKLAARSKTKPASGLSLFLVARSTSPPTAN